MNLSRANTELRCLIEELIVQTARQNLSPGLLDGKWEQSLHSLYAVVYYKEEP
ncbi:MAG: hypothetical protein SOW66_00510 [Porphyromonas sp.]|nr:hypothetical protein [Porphyromonas sp.]